MRMISRYIAPSPRGGHQHRCFDGWSQLRLPGDIYRLPNPDHWDSDVRSLVDRFLSSVRNGQGLRQEGRDRWWDHPNSDKDPDLSGTFDGGIRFSLGPQTQFELDRGRSVKNNRRC